MQTSYNENEKYRGIKPMSKFVWSSVLENFTEVWNLPQINATNSWTGNSLLGIETVGWQFQKTDLITITVKLSGNIDKKGTKNRATVFLKKKNIDSCYRL